jgi:hypothetical protein
MSIISNLFAYASYDANSLCYPYSSPRSKVSKNKNNSILQRFLRKTTNAKLSYKVFASKLINVIEFLLQVL